MARVPGRGVLRALGRYTAYPDARVAIANKVALVVVGNQPFYPLYLLAILGSAGFISCWTWATTPFFAAVPAVTRRNATAGRTLMCVSGLANTMLCDKLLGLRSGVGWFTLACALVALATFHRREWPVAVLLVLLCGVLGLAAPWLVGEPVLQANAADLASLTKLHLVSVGSLGILITYLRIKAA